MIKFLIKVGAILILLTFFATADACDYPVTVTESGTTCQGVLLTNDQFIEASNDKKTIRLQQLKLAEYDSLEDLYEARHKHYAKELRDTKNELKWNQIKSNTGYVISFAFGAIITGYIAKEVLK
jgi:hypothetical protein